MLDKLDGSLEKLSDDPIQAIVPAALDGASATEAALGLTGLPNTTVTTIIARGGLWIDGQRERDGTRLVATGSLLALRTPPGGIYRNAYIAAKDILYEDDWIIVLNKRPGWYVGATPWDCEGCVQAQLGHYLAHRDGEAPPLHLAHRLDRDTSGVLVVSKRPAANSPLQRAFAQHTARKRYLALCQGNLTQQQYLVETGIGRGPGGGFFVYPLAQVGPRTEIGRPPIMASQTTVTVIEHLRDASLVEARPITGRTHQIRLHLAHLGHPLLGDLRYGGPAEHAGLSAPHHMLHAAELVLPHPRGDRLIALRAAPPATFLALSDQLRMQIA